MLNALLADPGTAGVPQAKSAHQPKTDFEMLRRVCCD
jgi:hypothetical protein